MNVLCVKMDLTKVGYFGNSESGWRFNYFFCLCLTYGSVKCFLLEVKF